METNEQYQQWLEQGRKAYERGELGTARTCFEEAYWDVENPSPEVAAWLGKLDLREGNLEAAAYWVYETLNAAPGDVSALDELASVAVDCLPASASLEWAHRFGESRPDHPASRRLVSLIKKHRNWVRSTLSRSKKCRRSGDYGGAESLLALALERAPAEVRFLNERGQVSFEQGEMSGARRAFLAAHRLSPTDAYATNNLAKSYAREHRMKPAIRWYQKTLEHHPTDLYALTGLGQMELRRHRYEEAQRWFEQAVETAPDDQVVRQGLLRARRGSRVLDVVKEAKLLRRRKEYGKAEKVLLKAAAQLDNPVQIVVELGLVAHGSGRYDDARNLFVLAYQQEPFNVLVLNMLGALEVVDRHPGPGQFEAARKWYYEALSRAPRESRTLNNLGWLALRERRFGEALDCFDRVLQQQPENTRALRGKGEVAMRRGDYEEAQQWWDRSWWQNEQDDPVLMTSMARSSIAQGDFDTARSLLESAREKAPNDLYVLTSLAYLAIVQTRLDDAETLLESACALGEPDARVMNLLGKLCQKRGQFEAARKCYAATLGDDPDNTYALAGLGWTAYEAGRMDEAVHWFEQVINLDGTNPYALTGLGVTKARLGEFGEAQQCYQSSLQDRFHPPAVWHWFRLATLSGNAQQLRWFLEEAHEKGGFEQWISCEIATWRERVQRLMGLVRDGDDPWPYVNGLADQLPRCYHA